MDGPQLSGHRGVTPVIGVVLMAGIAVALATLVHVFVLGTAESVPNAVVADAQITQTVDGEYIVRPSDMGNANELRVVCGDQEKQITAIDDQAILSNDCGGTLKVIAETSETAKLIQHADTREATLTNSLPEREYALYVTVEDQNGNELQGATVQVAGDAYSDPHIVTPGTYLVTAEKSGSTQGNRQITYDDAARYVTVPDSDKFVTLVLDRSTTVNNGNNNSNSPSSSCSGGNTNSNVNQHNYNSGGGGNQNVNQSNTATVGGGSCSGSNSTINQSNTNLGGGGSQNVNQSNTARVNGGGSQSGSSSVSGGNSGNVNINIP